MIAKSVNLPVQLSKWQSLERQVRVWRFAGSMSLQPDVVPKVAGRWRMLWCLMLQWSGTAGLGKGRLLNDSSKT